LLCAWLSAVSSTEMAQHHALDGNSRKISEVEPNVCLVCTVIAHLPADKRMDNAGEEEEQEMPDRSSKAFVVPELSRQKVDQQLREVYVG